MLSAMLLQMAGFSSYYEWIMFCHLYLYLYILLQGIFPTQGLNPDLLHCRQILYHLSHQGSPIYIYILTHIYMHVCSVVLSCDSLQPMDCSLPASSLLRISQERILKWVAIPFPSRSSRSRDWTHVSCVFCIGRRFLTPSTWKSPYMYTHTHKNIFLKSVFW